MENVKLKVIKPLMSFIYLITYYLSLKIVGLRLTHRGQFLTWCTVGIIQGLFIGRYPLKKKNVKKLFLVLKQILVRKFHFLTYFFVVLFLMLWFFFGGLYLSLHTVKPLITNTSEEFIKCRLDNFSMSFILNYVNFSIWENK